jgi:hypothetical protein
MDLLKIMYYHSAREGNSIFPLPPHPLEAFKMKTALRIIALSVVLAGAAAASISPSTTRVFASHQAANANMPIPLCAPGLPTCPKGH